MDKCPRCGKAVIFAFDVEANKPVALEPHAGGIYRSKTYGNEFALGQVVLDQECSVAHSCCPKKFPSWPPPPVMGEPVPEEILRGKERKGTWIAAWVLIVITVLIFTLVCIGGGGK